MPNWKPNYISTNFKNQLLNCKKQLDRLPSRDYNNLIRIIKSIYSRKNKKLTNKKRKLPTKYLKISIIKTYERNTYISKDCVNILVQVYNGKTWTTLFIEPEIVGFKLGAFVPTRK